MNPEEVKAMVEAYRAGVEKAIDMVRPGEIFKGAFGVARDLGFEPDTIEWDGAVAGAMTVFRPLEILLDKDGRIVGSAA